MEYTYAARMQKDKKGFSVYFLDFPECTAHGRNEEVALINAKEALALYLYRLEKEHGWIPHDSMPFVQGEHKEMHLITIDLEKVKDELDRETVSISCELPVWLKQNAEAHEIDLSKLLEIALLEYVNVFERF